MLLFESIETLRRQVQVWRQTGERIAFVPTMGHLHAGHIELIKQAQTLADRVVVSIYVNPLQFDNTADLDDYPQTLLADRQQLASVATDILFLPPADHIYPYGMADSVRVNVPGLSEPLEGVFRPGHFSGMTTVVVKLFNIVQPDIALFGQKDFQQLVLIRRLVVDLLMPIDIVAVATVREDDGLAMSSRNSHLSQQERQQASVLYQVLSRLRAQWGQQRRVGVPDWRQLEKMAMRALEQQGLRADYVSIRDQITLTEPGTGPLLEGQAFVVLAAAWLGSTRLIDNVLLA